MPGTPTVESQTGLYSPDSVTWRVASENALMLGGGRALLLQLAHPLVAAGVGDHSDFLSAPVRRLERTITLTLRLVFGTLPEARDAARAVNRAHDRVQGVADGTPYRATDPDLLLWVHST
ncbi:MAG TPA: oxygenase MpaB family protein [Stellaceae bacterium]|nr:oxygenase MpaB family protein [Stellaceae bacterium]